MGARGRTGAAARRRASKIRSGDHVEVIAGKDRGKSGRVLRMEPRKDRIVVEGLNMVKRHTRPREVAGTKAPGQLGGVIEREAPIHISNVMLLDPKGKRTRVGIEREDGNRVRVAKSSGTRLD